MQRLAVYGTLMQGLDPHPNHPDIDQYLAWIGPCVIPGSLYSVGRYPALVLGRGQVWGEIWEVLDPALWPMLDDWEHEYQRQQIQLIDPDALSWVYVWNRSLETLSPIPSGDWREHIGL